MAIGVFKELFQCVLCAVSCVTDVFFVYAVCFVGENGKNRGKMAVKLPFSGLLSGHSIMSFFGFSFICESVSEFGLIGCSNMVRDLKGWGAIE